MKLKNLFLTSLVALALGACSNASEEATTTDATAQKNAVLSVNLAFPTSTTSRATDAGIDAEQTVKTITLRIHYTASAVGATTLPSDIVAQFTPSDWTAGALNANNEKPYTLNKIQVYPGTATVFATINSTTQTGTGDGTTDKVTTTTYTTLDALTSGTNAAVADNFIMTGQKNGVSLVANTDNSISANDPLKVDRIAAKLDEISQKEFVLSDAANITVVGEDGAEITDATAKANYLTVQMEAFSFVNLNNSSYLFRQNSAFIPTAADGYLNYFKAAKSLSNAAVNDMWKNIVNTTSGNTNTSVTYCYENAPLVANASYPVATQVIYKAKFKNITGNFYVIEKNGKKTLYVSFGALDNANKNGYSRGYGLSDASPADAAHAVEVGGVKPVDFYTSGVTKYTAAECYYSAPVKTDGIEKVVRNNWYKINVTKIKTIGGNYIDPNDPPQNSTWLEVNILVMPWTVQVNNVEL